MIRSKYADPQFWVDTADRVVATFFQAAVAILGVGTTGLLDVDFQQVLSVAGLAAVVALGTSIAFRGNGSDASTKPIDSGQSV